MTYIRPEYLRREIADVLQRITHYRAQASTAPHGMHFHFTASQLELMAEGLKCLETHTDAKAAK